MSNADCTQGREPCSVVASFDYLLVLLPETRKSLDVLIITRAVGDGYITSRDVQCSAVLTSAPLFYLTLAGFDAPTKLTLWLAAGTMTSRGISAACDTAAHGPANMATVAHVSAFS